MENTKKNIGFSMLSVFFVVNQNSVR